LQGAARLYAMFLSAFLREMLGGLEAIPIAKRRHSSVPKTKNFAAIPITVDWI
jgi:hypothetical protein